MRLRPKTIAKSQRVSHNCFVVGAFERNATVYSQQVRALNLAGAIQETLRDSNHGIVVVGGGTTGLTFAAAASCFDSVTVLEASERLLPKIRGNRTRWLHPRIYDWPLPGSEKGVAELPLLDWSADIAGDVAGEILNKWHEIRGFRDIEVELGVQESQVESRSGMMEVRWLRSNGNWSRPCQPRALVFCTGVGDDRLEHEPVGTSHYWRTDGLHQVNIGASVLISGGGDSGLIDMCRVLFEDFDHQDFFKDVCRNTGDTDLPQKLLEFDRELLTSRELTNAYSSLSLPRRLNSMLRDRVRRHVDIVLHDRHENPIRFGTARLHRLLLEWAIRRGHVTYRNEAFTLLGPSQAQLGSETIQFDRILLRHGPRDHPLQEWDAVWLRSNFLRHVAELDLLRIPLWSDEHVRDWSLNPEMEENQHQETESLGGRITRTWNSIKTDAP